MSDLTPDQRVLLADFTCGPVLAWWLDRPHAASGHCRGLGSGGSGRVAWRVAPGGVEGAVDGRPVPLVSWARVDAAVEEQASAAGWGLTRAILDASVALVSHRERAPHLLAHVEAHPWRDWTGERVIECEREWLATLDGHYREAARLHAVLAAAVREWWAVPRAGDLLDLLGETPQGRRAS